MTGWTVTEEREYQHELLAAVIAIWRHTEQHSTYVEGLGYTSRSDQQTCGDSDEHTRLAAAEGKAWHDYREWLAAHMPLNETADALTVAGETHRTTEGK